jgi:MoaA/NifB/PqqE/SkfB family radical SAM enzyme
MLDATLLLPALADLAAEGFRWVSLSGGEPILYPPLPKLLRHAHAQGLKTAVVSNGMLLNPKRLDTIAEHTDLLAISLDGKPSSHNAMRGSERAFEVMASRLEDIRARGLTFGFIFTLTQHNLDELPWVADFALNAGAKLLQIHPLECFGSAAVRLPGKVPDGLEGAYAWVLAQQIQKRAGPRMAVQIDLLYSEAVKRDPGLIYAGAQEEARNARLGELLSPLVVEPDGTAVPLKYGFSRAHALGNLHGGRIPELYREWHAERWPRFQRLCQMLYEQIVAAPSPYFFNWYEALAQLAEAQHIYPGDLRLRLPARGAAAAV